MPCASASESAYLTRMDPCGAFISTWSPLIFPQQAETADKVPPHGADLTELRGVLDERVTEGDAVVVRGEGQPEEPLEGRRDGESGGPVGGMCCRRKRGCTIECVLARARWDRTVDTAMRAKI